MSCGAKVARWDLAAVDLNEVSFVVFFFFFFNNSLRKYWNYGLWIRMKRWDCWGNCFLVSKDETNHPQFVPINIILIVPLFSVKIDIESCNFGNNDNMHQGTNKIAQKKLKWSIRIHKISFTTCWMTKFAGASR